MLRCQVVRKPVVAASKSKNYAVLYSGQELDPLLQVVSVLSQPCSLVFHFALTKEWALTVFLIEGLYHDNQASKIFGSSWDIVTHPALKRIVELATLTTAIR